MNNNQIRYKGVTVERLLDYLGDKTLSFGCESKWENKEGKTFKGRLVSKIGTGWDVVLDEGGTPVWWLTKNIEIIGHPVMIGDVLKKMSELDILHDTWKDGVQYGAELYSLWENCGLGDSLNEILSGDTKESQALFEFLVDTFYDELK